MTMKDFIDGERVRLQKLFEPFNETGSWMHMRQSGYEPLGFGLIDSYTVTRVAPHFDAAGNPTKTDFWVLFKSAGYNNGWQYSHTAKIVGWSQGDTYLIDLTDDMDRRYHIELILAATEPVLVFDWRKWRGYKSENADLFREIDAQLLAEHVAIAEGWE